jgi:hypothetical protein
MRWNGRTRNLPWCLANLFWTSGMWSSIVPHFHIQYSSTVFRWVFWLALGGTTGLGVRNIRGTNSRISWIRSPCDAGQVTTEVHLIPLRGLSRFSYVLSAWEVTSERSYYYCNGRSQHCVSPSPLILVLALDTCMDDKNKTFVVKLSH